LTLENMRFVLLLLIFSCVVFAEPKWEADYSGHQIRRCLFESETAQSDILRVASEHGISIHGRLIQGVDLMIPPHKSHLFSRCQVLVHDVQQKIEEEDASLLESRQLYQLGKIDYYDTYHPYTEIFSYVQQLSQKYPDLSNFTVLGRTLEGRDIPVIHVRGRTKNIKKTVYFNSGIHAREWIGPACAVYIIENLLSKYGTDEQVSELMDQIEFVISPISNPDGYSFAWTSDRTWRKNRNPNDGSICKGVDLNRNFDVYWGTNSGRGKCDQDYHGTGPASEPEIRGIQDYVSGLANKIGGIDIHSYGQYIMRPYGWTYDRHPDEAIIKRLGDGIVSVISKVPGGAKYSSIRSADLYPVSGASDDWLTVKQGLWGFTFEVRDTGRYGFKLPENQIRPTATEIFAAVLEYAGFVLENFPPHN